MHLLDPTVSEYLAVFLYFHKHFTHNNILISQNTVYELGAVIIILQIRKFVYSNVMDIQVIYDKTKVCIQ